MIKEIFFIPKADKIRLLESLLKQFQRDTILIFSRTKHGAKKIARDIRSMGHSSTEIHSNRAQAQRKAALEGFSRGKFRIMVATDIAARGIDVKDISVVINYDLPDNSEDYVHRIGRTGRAGRSGKAISFATTSQKADIKKIERLIRKSLPVVQVPALPPHQNRVYNEPEEKREYRTQRNNRNSNYKQGDRSNNRRSRSSASYKPQSSRTTRSRNKKVFKK